MYNVTGLRVVACQYDEGDPDVKVEEGSGAAALVSEPHVAHTHAVQDHDHDHDHQAVPSDQTLRVKALESLLVEKGLVDRAALDAVVDAYETRIGPRNGARVVARAWVDPAYKKRLIADASAAIAELGYVGGQGEDMVVLENSPKIHNLVVCTLCSCYPWPVLGLPPVWYKSAPYRSRAVIDPRGVLREFGLELAEEVDVRVWDSTAEVRYLVRCENSAEDGSPKNRGVDAFEEACASGTSAGSAGPTIPQARTP